MVTSLEPVPDETKQRGLLSQTAVDAIGIVSSLAAGAATAWVYIERSVYKNMSSLGTFDDVKPLRRQQREAIEQAIEKGEITPKQSYRMLDDLIATQEKGAVGRLEKFGIYNVADRWNLLRRHQKVETVIFSIAAGGVALGSILPLAQNLFTKPQQEALGEKDPSPQP